MFLQKLSSFLFAATTTLTLGTALLAQGGGLAGSLGTVLGPTSGAIYVAPTPPTLPPYESRTSSFDRSIGNSWLGGSVHAYASMARQKSGSYELGFATVEMNGIARVLQQSREVFDVVATCMNVRNNTAQTRSGYLRIEMLGATVIDQSVAATTGFGSQTYTFNLLPGGVSASVPGAGIASGDDAALLAPVRAALYDPDTLDAALAARWRQWLLRWQQRLTHEALSAEQIVARMDAVNPLYLPRNYLAQEAIDAAEQGDLAPLLSLMRVLQRPYVAQAGCDAYAARRPEWARQRPGCSALSCSS